MNFYSTEGVSPPPSSPVHSLAELPQSLRLQDIYHDPRKVPGPSLYVKATLGLSAVTGSIAKNSNGVHCAVAGRDCQFGSQPHGTLLTTRSSFEGAACYKAAFASFR